MRSGSTPTVVLLALLAGSCSQSAKQAPQTVPTPAATMVAPAAAPAPLTRDQELVADEHGIAAAQRALIQLSYNVGKADGVCGAATRRAILAFQKDHALVEDGRLTVGLANMLNTLLAQGPKINATTVAVGDIVIFGDGSTEIVNNERVVPWEQEGGRALLAIRPSTAGWPQAARAGLDWATTHALDVAGGPAIQWSSTGVDQHFEIVATAALSPRETALAGSAAQSCRHFELRADGPQKHYPGVACPYAEGGWYLPHSRIRLARPATGLGSLATDAAHRQ